MAGALAARHTDKELEKGRVEKTTVKRYWPGRAPDWVNSRIADDAAVPTEEAIAQQVQRTAISAPVIVKKVADPRLARLSQRKVDRDEAVQEHRQIRAAEVVRRRRQRGDTAAEKASSSSGESVSDESSSSDEESEDGQQQPQQQEQEVDEEELQRRRDALRER